MIIMDLVQGSEAWHKFRAEHDTASEASIVKQCSKNVSRSELLREKATGSEREFSAWFEKNILDKGHQVEALARPIVEAELGEELYPVTGKSEDYERMAASFDGITMLGDIVWECKQWNEEKAASVREGKIPECDLWQVIQQLIVSRARVAVYTVSDGTKERTISCQYKLLPGEEEDLVATWRQFNEDRANFKAEPERAQAVGETPESLPALRISLTGAVTASNLQDFKTQALARIEAIKTDLQTDQDFADAEQTTKFLKAGEQQLENAKKQALADTASIDELFRTVDDLKEQMRQKRLTLEKLVKAEKENRRLSILQKASEGYAEWLEAQECPVKVSIQPDIAGAMKGKKSIKGWEDAAADAVASAKIDARKEIERIKENYQGLKSQAGEYMFLFPDWAQLIQRDSEFLQLHIKQTIAEHQKREAEKLEAERERIRQQEEAKALANAKQQEAEPAMQCHSPSPGEPGHPENQERPALGESPLLQRASQIKQPEQVTISRAEYQRLLESEALLEALKAHGVEKLACWRKATEQLEAA